jgi:hypothetical protein
MRMKPLFVAALLSGACGGGMEASAPPGGASTVSDAGSPTPDGGTLPPEGCDCSGMALPDICMMCTQTESMCAHFVCNSGQCEVRVCP